MYKVVLSELGVRQTFTGSYSRKMEYLKDIPVKPAREV
jgi:hypothetical protein